jgi:hypothetical protein
MDAKHQEQLARMRKKYAQKEKSLSIKIQESDLYDWNPTARFLLDVIARLQVTNEDAYFPEDCPDDYKDDRLGWCWMSQYELGLRIGRSESQVHRYIIQFENDEVIEVRRWKDSNNADHDMYRVNEKMVEAHQRPSQDRGVERPSRYKKPRPKKGWFSTTNQPRRVRDEIAEMDEELA